MRAATEIDLLFDLLDLPDPALSPVAFGGPLRKLARPLLDLGLLVAEGQEATVASDDHDDAPIALVWSANHGEHGYFSPTAGWVSVQPPAIIRYRLDIPAVVSRLLESVRAGSGIAKPVAQGLGWDAGDIRLPHRTRRTPVWLVRRVGDTSAWQTLRTEAIARPPPRTRLLLASTWRRQFPGDVPSGNILVSLRDLIPSDGRLALDGMLLSSVLDHQASAIRSDESLTVLAEGREVRFLGKVYRFPKGDQQRRIIVYLEQRYRSGDLVVPVAAVVAALDLPARARIRDYFKSRNVMSELLFEAGGTCGFRFPGSGGK